MRVFRASYHADPPAAATFFKRGKRQYARWTAKGGKAIEAERVIGKRGKGEGKVRYRVLVTDVWYVEWTDPRGKKQTRKGFPGRKESDALARRLQVESDQVRAGLRAAASAAADRPIRRQVEDYAKHLGDRGDCPKYVADVRGKLLALVGGAGASDPAELTPDAVLGWVGDRRAEGRFGATTANKYVACCRSFLRWLVRCKRATSNPLDGVPRIEAGADRRRARRSLTEPEFLNLLGQARASRSRRRRVNAAPWGEDRYWLYLLAGYTGLRAAELASLEATSFRLALTPPPQGEREKGRGKGMAPAAAPPGVSTVTVAAGYSKHRREDTLPLHPDVAAALAAWLARKPAGRLWPGRWYRRAAELLRPDLEAIGVPYRDDRGRYADFHALRRTYITRLIRSGADPKKVQRLARHGTIGLTFDVYADVEDAELAAAAAMLPPPPMVA